METDHFDRLSERRGDCSATEKVDRSVTAEETALRPKRLIAQ